VVDLEQQRLVALDDERATGGRGHRSSVAQGVRPKPIRPGRPSVEGDVTSDIVLLVIGLVVIGVAADQAVVGSARVAEHFNLPRVLLGAVLIGLGTSLPEAVVSVLAATDGRGELAYGNLIGSNTANIGLVLGVAAIVAASPLVVDSGILTREVPLALGSSLLFALVVLAGAPWPFGLLLLVTGAVVGRILLAHERDVPEPPGDIELEREVRQFSGVVSVPREVTRALVGLALTLGAAEAVLLGATGVADELGIGEGLVGLAIIAVGTSLPELVTAITAVRRGEDELVLGNVLGSNLANSLLVGGVATLAGAAGTTVTPTLREGALMMATLVVLAAAALGRRLAVSRPEGVLLLAAYVLGMVWIAL
jgi:cation:H+ antiporter